MAETTHLDTLKINVLTKAQFAGATKDPNQIYMISDEEEAQEKLIGSPGQFVGFDASGNAVAQNLPEITPDTLVPGDDNGTVKFNGANVQVTGLKSAAYTESTAYDKAGTAAGIKSELQGQIDSKASKSVATTTNDGLMSSSDKVKLNGIDTGAEVNQNTFSNVVVGSTTIVADSKTDTLNFVAGANISISANAVTDTVSISATDTKYTHPTYASKPSGLYKVTVDGTGHVSATTGVTKSDITGLGIPAQDTTYSAVTQTASGLMSAEDKVKLDGIAQGANKITVDSTLNSTSTNPIQNKAVNAALAGKSDTGHTHNNYVNQNAFSNIAVGGSTIAADTPADMLTLDAGSNITLTTDVAADKITISATDTTYSVATASKDGLMSASDKTKLIGIESGANKYVLPAATSTALGGVKNGENIANNSGTISVANASTTTKGVVQLNNGYTSTSTTMAPTANALKTSHDVLKAYIDNSVGGIVKFDVQVVTSLPASGIKGTIYLIACTHNPSEKDSYDEYLWTGTAFEKIGNTDVNLVEYAKKTDIPTKLSQLTNDKGYTTNVGTITGITTSAPLSGSGTAGSIAISHANSGVTAGNYGDTTDQVPAFGSTFKVPYVAVNATGHTTSASTHTVTIPSSVATQSDNGLMSSTDKTKLDGVATGANKTVVDSILSTTSTNPVQNKVINSALEGKSNTNHGHSDLASKDIVYVGTEAPTDPNAKIWIDTDEELSDNSLKAVSLTSAEYDALQIKDDNTLYMLTDTDEEKAASETYVNNRTKNYIVDEGISGDWAYRKWNSGFAECWSSHLYICDITTAWGALFETKSTIGGLAFPFTFTDAPLEFVTLVSNGAGGMLESSIKATTTKSGQFYIVRGTSGTGNNFYLNSYVTGLWK